MSEARLSGLMFVLVFRFSFLSQQLNRLQIVAYWQVAGIEIKRSKGITRGKSDKIDSKDIAFYAYVHVHKFRQSSISSNSVHQLRLLFTTCHDPLNLLFVNTIRRGTPAIAPNRSLCAVHAIHDCIYFLINSLSCFSDKPVTSLKNQLELGN